MAVKTITENNFNSEVLNSDKVILLDFWADWCGPCRMLSPIVDKLAEEMPEIKVGKVNVDDEPDLATQYGIMNIPTVLLFENGRLVDTLVGFHPKEELDAFLSDR